MNMPPYMCKKIIIVYFQSNKAMWIKWVHYKWTTYEELCEALGSLDRCGFLLVGIGYDPA